MNDQFYRAWKLHQEQGCNCDEYILAFLQKESYSVRALKVGKDEVVQDAIDALVNEPFDNFIQNISNLSFDREVMPAEVPQFSSFDDAAIRLLGLLQFTPNGLTFDDAGYQLVKSVRAGAQKKYGENHSKLAEMMSLVTISFDSPRIIKNTSLGNAILMVTENLRHDLLRKLLLREYLFQKLIYEAQEDCFFYRDVVENLADSTARRRATNVRFILNYILEGTNYERLLYNVNWQV